MTASTNAVSATRARVEDDAGPGESTTAEVLALLDDEHVREILLALVGEPKPASAIAACCDCSRPTVYRRLERLCASGLVTTSLSVDADGHHRKLFHGRLDRVSVDLGAGGWSVTVRKVEASSNG